MWLEKDISIIANGWLELDDQKVLFENAHLRVKHNKGTEIELDFRLDYSRELSNRLSNTNFHRVVLENLEDTYVAICASPDYTIYNDQYVLFHLHPMSLSKEFGFERETRCKDDFTVSYDVVISPPLHGLENAGLSWGLHSFGDYEKRDGRSSLYCHCGITGFRAQKWQAARKPGRGRHSTETTVVEYHVLSLDRTIEERPKILPTIDDLRELSRFLMAMLGCAYQVEVRSVADNLSITEGQSGERHYVERAHRSNKPVQRVPRVSTMDLGFTAFTQGVVSAWPVSEEMKFAAYSLSSSFGMNPEAAYLSRYLALETLVAYWIRSKGGKAVLKRHYQEESSLWPRKTNGKRQPWNNKIGEEWTPSLNNTIRACLEDLEIEYHDIMNRNLRHKPDFIKFRDDMMHGRPPKHTIDILRESAITRVLTMRLLVTLLELPEQFLAKSGRMEFWFLRDAVESSQYISMPAKLKNPITIDLGI